MLDEKTETATDDVDQLEHLITRLEAGAFARQRLIDLVRTSESKFRILKSQIPAMIWTMDCDLRFTGIFGARLSYTDPSATELLGRSIFDFFQAENPETLSITAGELLNRGETAVYELKRKDRIFQIHIGPLRERGTEVLGGVGVAVEITDRKDAEALVQASEQKYRELFETSEDFVYTFDLDGNFVNVSNAARRITGYEIHELKQMNLAQVVAPEHRSLVRQMIESLLGGQPPRPLELEFVAKDGRKVWLDVSPRLNLAGGCPVGFHGISHDITERKRAELLERDRGQILELIARNETLDTILMGINQCVDRLVPQAICSIWRDQDGFLNHAGYSRLPDDFVHGFHGLRIRSDGWPGACAALLGKVLASEDVSTDAAWQDYRDAMASHHLLACCFVPIMGSSGDTLGIVGIFFAEPRSPDKLELAELESASRLAALAIEHQQALDKLSEQPSTPTDRENPDPAVQPAFSEAIAPLTVAVLVGNRLLSDQVESCLRSLPVKAVLKATEISGWPALIERLDHSRPEVVVVDIGLFRDTVPQSIAAIRNSSSAPIVVALHATADRDLILSVVQAGASEYLYPPLNTHLQKALERIIKDREAKRTHGAGGRVVGLLSAKGGCGATTIACHLAVELQRLTTQNVLLADYDLGSGMVGILMKATSPYSLLDAASNIYRLDLSLWKGLVSNGRKGLEVIAGPALPNLRNLPREANFRQILRFAKNHYDWIVVDLGRGLSSFSMSALEEIDETFVVTSSELTALLQAKRVVQSLFDEGFGSHRIHLLLNRSSKGQYLTNPELEKMLGLNVYASIPEDASALEECYTRGELLSSSSRLGKHFANLAAKLTGAKPAEKAKEKRRFPSFRVR